MSIKTKAMLVNLSISQWTARKFDRKTTEEVDAQHGTDQAGRFNKILIAQDAIRTVAQAATAARTYHYTNTLPWSDNGARVLPTTNYLEYTAEIQRFKAQFENAAQTLINNYPALIDDARQALKSLFNPSDYPAPEEIASKYRFKIDIDAIPEAADFRVDINAAELANLQAEIEDRTQRLQAAAMQDLYKRLYDVITHAAETLKSPDKIFRDSLIGNIADVVDLLPRLNLTGDKALDDLTQQAKRTLAGLTPDDLRTKPIIRSIAAQDAAAILENMKSYMGA